MESKAFVFGLLLSLAVSSAWSAPTASFELPGTESATQPMTTPQSIMATKDQTTAVPTTTSADVMTSMRTNAPSSMGTIARTSTRNVVSTSMGTDAPTSTRTIAPPSMTTDAPPSIVTDDSTSMGTDAPSTMTTVPKEDCNTKKADIVFLLDASFSEGNENFEKQKKFVQNITSSLDVRQDGIRVALVTFSNEAHLQFLLNTHKSKQRLLTAIEFAPYQPGLTYTNLGLQFIREHCFQPAAGDRQDVQNVVIVLTDGASTKKADTLVEAQKLKRSGSIIITVGIGGDLGIDVNELYQIASGKDYSLKIDDFDILLQSVDLLEPLICNAINGKKVPEEPVQCAEREIDFALVLDGSTSEGRRHFKEETDFAADLVSRLDVGKTKTQVGVVTFSDRVWLHFPLNKYNNTKAVVDAIRKVPIYGGSTYTGKALKFVRTHFFTADRGSRKGVQKAILVMTDGQSSDEDSTKREANLLKKEKVLVFAVGIGDAVHMPELELIATEKSMAFEVESFDALKDFLPKFKSTYCNKTVEVTTLPPTTIGPTKLACENKKTDVIFVLDASSSEGLNNFNKQVYFVRSIVQVLPISPEQVQVALLTFSTGVHNQFYLNQYMNDKAGLMEAIKKTPYAEGLTYTDGALAFVRAKSMAVENGRRLDAQTIVIILTDGQSSNNQATLYEAKQLQATGSVIMTIGIGASFARATDELRAIATDDDHVFSVGTFDLLKSIKDEIVQQACKSIP